MVRQTLDSGSAMAPLIPPKPGGNRYPWDEWLIAPLPLILRVGVEIPEGVQPLSLANLFRIRLAGAGLERTIHVARDRIVVLPKCDRRGARKKIG